MENPSSTTPTQTNVSTPSTQATTQPPILESQPILTVTPANHQVRRPTTSPHRAYLNRSPNSSPLHRPPPQTLELLPPRPVITNKIPHNTPMLYHSPNLTNGFLTMAERQTFINGPTTHRFCRGLNLASSSLPNHRNPPRPNLTRPLAPVPTYPPAAQTTLRDRLITLSPTEFIFQTYHPHADLFSGTNNTQRIFLEVRQEREILMIGEENQYRVRMLPQPTINGHTQVQNPLRF